MVVHLLIISADAMQRGRGRKLLGRRITKCGSEHKCERAVQRASTQHFEVLVMGT